MCNDTEGTKYGLKPLITPTEAASLGVATDRHIRRMCERGEIKAVLVGNRWRINRDSLLKQFGLMEVTASA
jgi:excisionase family DNA binding protein